MTFRFLLMSMKIYGKTFTFLIALIKFNDSL